MAQRVINLNERKHGRTFVKLILNSCKKIVLYYQGDRWTSEIVGITFSCFPHPVEWVAVWPQRPGKSDEPHLESPSEEDRRSH